MNFKRCCTDDACFSPVSVSSLLPVCMSRKEKFSTFWKKLEMAKAFSWTVMHFSTPEWLKRHCGQFHVNFLEVMHYCRGLCGASTVSLSVTFTMDIFFPGKLKYLWGSDARRCCFSVNSWHSVPAAIHLKRLSALSTVCPHKQQGIFIAWIITKVNFYAKIRC